MDGEQGAEGDTERLLINLFSQFLLEFHSKKSRRSSVTSNNNGGEEHQTGKYAASLGSMIENEQTTIRVDFSDLRHYNPELASTIENDYSRYERPLREGAKQACNELRRRKRGGEEAAALTREEREAEDQDLFVAFHSIGESHKLRDLRSEKISRLVAARGTVTRTSDVRPELLLGTFVCLKCGLEIKDIEQQLRYTTPTICTNSNCNNSSSAQWQLVMESSRFVDWQRLRVQESPDEIPAGSLPRAFDVIVRDEMVEKAYAGDRIMATGSLAVVPDASGLSRSGESAVAQRSVGGTAEFNQGLTGTKIMGSREMTYKLVFVACDIEKVNQKSQFEEEEDDDDDEEDFQEDEDVEARRARRRDTREAALCERIRTTPQLYDALAQSIAPSVYGHADIKRGILLQLVGGVHKVTEEGIKLRGDVNVCIVGDPSTAKSQFLKYVHSFMPRAVYTSGKAASAAGLTATVVRDPETGEFCVEAGALMLADNGICCIDEFDKMEITDQVAIHEAMEQQTISIAKAGIHANLNARASILAAANPKHGRYDRTKTLKANVEMTAPIMSRFDLFFIVIDDCDELADRAVATHIVDVHRGSRRVLAAPFKPGELATYIRITRARSPQISPEAQVRLVWCYKQLRQNDVVGRSKTAYRITVRQLESLIRLSEAGAKIHMVDIVTTEHVEEAFRLLKKSIITVESEAVVLDDMEEEYDEEQEAMDDADAVAAAERKEDDEEAAASQTPVDTAPEETAPDTAPEGEEEKKKSKKAKRVKEKVKLSYEDYQRYCGKIVLHLKRRASVDGVAGLRRSAIIEWYNSTHAEEVGDEESQAAHAKLLKQILKRLHKDETLIVVATEDNEPILAVHPNFDLGS